MNDIFCAIIASLLFKSELVINEFVHYSFDKPFHAIVREVKGKTATLQVVQDHTNPNFNIWGITARNKEQNFALNLLLDPEVDFVSLLGQAGTGKTLLTLAAGLQQVLEKKIYSEKYRIKTIQTNLG